MYKVIWYDLKGHKIDLGIFPTQSLAQQFANHSKTLFRNGDKFYVVHI